jgi:hypothetical protein
MWCKKLSLSILMALNLVAIGTTACAEPEPSEVPEELIGVWVTDDPRYEGRFLKLEPRKIHFGMGGDQASENPIVEVETIQEEGMSIYRIHYLSPEGLEYTQSLNYDPESGEVRYKNRPSVVWKRVEIEIEATESARSGFSADGSDSAAELEQG